MLNAAACLIALGGVQQEPRLVLAAELVSRAHVPPNLKMIGEVSCLSQLDGLLARRQDQHSFSCSGRAVRRLWTQRPLYT